MKEFDAIIVGSGAAGLYTALQLPADWRIALLTKENLKLSSSQWAQGGIAAVIDPDDSFRLHVEDTLRAGAGLCEIEAVKVLVEEAPERIKELIDLGVEFDRYQGRLAVTLEAAHSRRRILHAADATGKELVRALVEDVQSQPHIQVIEEALAIDLAVDSGRCWGVLVEANGRREWYTASVTILATGGAGQAFAHTTNPAVSTGDGIAMAARAGVAIRDMEFVQFHPTALLKPGAPRFLISEAVRGEGAHLLNLAGERFMLRYDPKAELATRDVVARSIFAEMQRGADPYVYLDLKPLGEAVIDHRFPNIAQVCRRYDIDIYNEPIPVAPAANYWMGGIVTDLEGRTTLKGLYAVGESASTGVHGANRLASNSLLECLVFAHRIAADVRQVGKQNIQEVVHFGPTALGKPADPATVDRIRSELPWLCWHACGIIRDHQGLNTALETIRSWKHLVQQNDWTVGRESLETRNLVFVAEMLLSAALFRTESRGGHYRRDYPETDPHWAVHTLLTGESILQSPLGVVKMGPLLG